MEFYAIIAESDTIGARTLGGHDVSDNVHFGTKLNGGFSTCEFDIFGTNDGLYDLSKAYLGRPVTIKDMFGFTCFEGRIINVAISDKNTLSCKASGFYEDGSVVFNDLIYLAEPSRVNFCKNPSFENNVTDSWSHNGNGSVARVTAENYYGSASCRVTQPTNSSNTLEYTFWVDRLTNDEFTFSLFAKKGTITTTPQIAVRQMSGTGGGGSEVKLNTKSLSGISDSHWIRYSIYIESSEETTLSYICKVTVKGDPAGGTFFIDAVQMEDGQISSYLDGSLGDGYSWSGTAHNSASERENMYPYAKDVISDACAIVDSWRLPVISSTFDSRIDTDLDFSQEKVTDAVEEVLKFGYSDTDFLPAYFAIYDNGTPVIKTQTHTGTIIPDWYVSIRNVGGQSYGTETSIDDVFNKVFAVYDNANDGISVTLPAEDYRSQQRYGIREGLLDNGDAPGGLALAEDLRDTALAKYRSPRRMVSITIFGYVRDRFGTLTPAHRVKAGDTVVITDIDTMYALAENIAQETLIQTNGFVFGTDYDAKNNTIKLDIGSEDLSFDVLMSRLGLSGGLS